MVLAIIVFQGLIFLGLIFILRQFMKGHVSGAVGHLQKLNDELLKQQADLKQKNIEAQAAYDDKMAKLQIEISQKQAQVKDEATKALEEARARALGEREKIINEAVETRDKMRQEVMAEMEEKAIQHSQNVIKAFLTEELQTLVHNTLVHDVIEGIREAKTDLFQISDAVAEFRAALPIKDEDKQKIQKILKEKIKKDVQIKETIDPSLVGGMILKFGTFVIDGSLINRLKEAAAVLRRETARRYQAAS